VAYSEIYNRVNWQDDPDTSTPLDAYNLNQMDACLKAFDILIKTIGNSAMYAEDIANCLVGPPTIDQSTGIITFPKKDGGNYTLDTLLEKVLVNFDWDETTQILTITLEDGTVKPVDLSALIQENEFVDSNNIVWTITGHRVGASIKAHSIGPNELQLDYLADCQAAKDNAEAAESNAETAEENAQGFAQDAEAWSSGTINGQPVPASHPAHNNNAEYWKNQAQAIANNELTGLSDVSIENPEDGQAFLYNLARDKWVNGFMKIPVNPTNTTDMNIWIET